MEYIIDKFFTCFVIILLITSPWLVGCIFDFAYHLTIPNIINWDPMARVICAVASMFILIMVILYEMDCLDD